MYASVRTYRVRAGSVDDLAHRVDRDFAEALRQEPGFIAYQCIDADDGLIVSISVFRDRAQAERSAELAAQWVAEELDDFDLERTGVIAGEVKVSRAIADVLEPAHA